MPSPRGLTYAFVVDCKDGHCEANKEKMRKMGFNIKKSNTSLGDHIGTKRFATEREANSTADNIHRASKSKIWQIAVVPETEL